MARGGRGVITAKKPSYNSASDIGMRVAPVAAVREPSHTSTYPAEVIIYASCITAPAEKKKGQVSL